MLNMADEAGGDDKILCVPSTDPRVEHLRDYHHISEFERQEIQHFFSSYKDLEPGKYVHKAEWQNRAAAETEINLSFQRFAALPDSEKMHHL